ncbi:unnamed protein product [Ambrosiozyma monospora]|uniref:Unnamed protein product n=1 Tax=Ambrosiozyma monospora TaxID=43982 RepID=A0ACB5T7W2_AMBMO|nr:unnamed protein product [Ambrosiozyma monospora]
MVSLSYDNDPTKTNLLSLDMKYKGSTDKKNNHIYDEIELGSIEDALIDNTPSHKHNKYQYQKLETNTSSASNSDNDNDNDNVNSDSDSESIRLLKEPEQEDFTNLKDTRKLRRVTGDIPKVAYLVCLVEFTERLSYFMITGCITNMVQRPLPKGSTNGSVLDLSSDESPGALGMGLGIASLVSQLLMFAAYISPLYSGYLADTKLGKYKSLVVGTLIGSVGHGLLVLASVPAVLKIIPVSFVLTLISIVTIAISAGFIKPNLLPLLLDQYPVDKDTVKKLDSGEFVVVDYRATLEKLSLSFYLFVNCGCFIALFGSFIERRYGFWVVYFITMFIYMLLPLLLWFLKPRLRNLPPEGKSIYDEVIPMLKQLFSEGWISRSIHGQFWSIDTTTSSSSSNNLKLSDFKTTCEVCVLFLYFIIFNLNDNTLSSIQINQAGSMQADGLPNDFFQYFNPLAILITIPFLDFVLYPFLRRLHINFTSIHKITLGFLLGVAGSLIGALIQQIIYNTSQCGSYASTCPTASPISAWWSGLMFSLQAIGECFASVTAYELAYSKSPAAMRSLVVGIYLLMMALSSVVGSVLAIWSKDPYLVWVFGGVGGVGLVCAVVFYFHFADFRKSERVN